MELDVNKQAVSPQIALDCEWTFVVHQDVATELSDEIEAMRADDELSNEIIEELKKELDAAEGLIEKLKKGIANHKKEVMTAEWGLATPDGKLWNLIK